MKTVNTGILSEINTLNKKKQKIHLTIMFKM